MTKDFMDIAVSSDPQDVALYDYMTRMELQPRAVLLELQHIAAGCVAAHSLKSDWGSVADYLQRTTKAGNFDEWMWSEHDIRNDASLSGGILSGLSNLQSRAHMLGKIFGDLTPDAEFRTRIVEPLRALEKKLQDITDGAANWRQEAIRDALQCSAIDFLSLERQLPNKIAKLGTIDCAGASTWGLRSQRSGQARFPDL